MSEHLSSEEAAKSPLDRSVRSPGTFGYLACYVCIGVGSLLIVSEVVESGLWLKLGSPLLLIWFGVMMLILLRKQERERQTASPSNARL